MNADGLGTQLRTLLELLDGDLETIYARDGFGYRPRYTPVMKALADGPPLRIKDLASRSSITHSAASQTVAKMGQAGLVATTPGEDGRTRLVGLTERGEAMLPTLRRRWAATTAAARELDRELSVPLSRVLAEAIAALRAEPFASRIQRCG